MTDQPASEATLSRAQWISLYLLTAVLMLGYGAIFSLLAEIRDRFGFSPTGIGFIGANAFVSGFIAQIGLARFADAGYGRRMLQAGVVICIVSTAWMVVAESLTAWILSRGLLGFGAGMVRPAIRRLVVVSDPIRAGRALGLLASWETAGFLMGPVIAAGLHTWVGFEATFIVMTLLLVFFLPVLRHVEIPAASTPPGRMIVFELLALPSMQSCLAMGVAFWITIGVFEAIWAIFMSDLGASLVFIGLSMSMFGIPMVIISPMAGEFSQRRGPLQVATVTITVAMACMLFYGVIDSIWWMCLPLLVHACADAFTMPATQLAVTQASGEDAIAAGQGLFGATGMVVGAVAAASSGMLYEEIGAAGLWWSATAAMVLLVVFAWWRGKELRDAEPT